MISGWVKGEYQGEEILAHGGDTFTTHTFLTLSRQRQYGIFVSSTGGSKGLFLLLVPFYNIFLFSIAYLEYFQYIMIKLGNVLPKNFS